MRWTLLFFLLPFALIAQRTTPADLWSLNKLQTLDNETVIDVFVDAEGFEKLENASSYFVKYYFQRKYALRAKVSEVKNLMEIEELNLRLDFNSGTVLSNNSKNLSAYDTTAMKALFRGRRYTGRGVLIGVIDAGIDFNHPDFLDEQGNTRVLKIWDQTQSGNASRVPSFGYGQVWDSSDINLGICTHQDQNQWFGHGSNVSGIAAGDGSSVPDSIADYSGYAPEASLAVVSIDFGSLNFTEKVADGTQFIYDLADSLGMPCVINASLGTYVGSHDGKDFQSQRIQAMINAKEGRSFVCAAGNAGEWPAFHLDYDLNNDTNFTWFDYLPNQQVFFELWADSAQASQLDFQVSLDHNLDFASRALNTQRALIGQLGQVITDTLKNGTNVLGLVQIWRVMDAGRLRMQVFAPRIDSAQYKFRFQVWGTGSADLWSSGNIGSSNIILSPTPDPALFPEFVNYKQSDVNQSIVSSWACLDELITVGNLINNSSYTDYSGNTQSYPFPQGSIAPSSSRGPSRIGGQKPDLVAPGERSFSAGRLVDLSIQRNVAALHYALAPGGFHNRNGGTSMASPAVAGSIALLLERCPKIDQQTIQSFLKQSLKPRPGQKNIYGDGQLNTSSLLEQSTDLRNISSSDPNLEFLDGDTIQLSLAQGLDSLTWSTGNTNRFQEVSASGTFYASFSNQYACPASSDTLMTIKHYPKQFSLPSDTAFCVGSSFGLSGGFDTYLWSTGETSPSITPLRDGNFGLITTDSNSSQWRDSILLREIFPIPIPFLGNDTSICRGDLLVLYPGPYSAYKWSNGSELAVQNIRKAGTVAVTVTDSNQCIGNTQIEVFQETCIKPTGIEASAAFEAKLFPNPSNGISMLELNEAPEAILILNAKGQAVRQISRPIDRKMTIEAQGEGLYVVQLRYANGNFQNIKWLVQ